MGIIYYYTADGVAYYQYTNSMISLTGENSVLGRAIHVHQNSDDCTDPVGNGGARLAQCVIGVTPQVAPNYSSVPNTQDAYSCTILRPFPRCIVVNTAVGSEKICLDLQFTNCAFNFSLTLNGLPLLPSKSYPITQFKNFFQEVPVCSRPPCKICLQWSNLVLNQTTVAGCGTITFDCGVPIPSYPLGCFSDSQIAPRCFANCPNSCSFNGICSNGMCQCSNSWTGPDCSMFYNNCPNSCGGSIRGKCINNACVCNPNFSGNDCSVYATASSPSSGPSVVLIVLIVLILLAVIATAAGIGIWLYRRRIRPPTFTPLYADDDETEMQ